MLKSKNAIGVIIALSLLIVITVSSVVVFNNWYASYSSDLFAKTETSGSDNSVSVKDVMVEQGQLQIYAYSSSNYEFINDIQINGVSCNLIGSDVIDISLTKIALDCAGILGEKNLMTLYTSSKIYKYEFFI